MSPSTRALPQYLKKYVSVQDYEKYTPQDHAAWRYIMRQNRAYFSRHAHPIYLEGLKKTGIPLDRIPRISEMDDCLSKFGWGAVPVIGFIPPSAFLEFQARGVLPIACDMRTVSHIAYTPAPDIVHEAAGHAPIIADSHYARYLNRYAKMAEKAIQTREDIRVYEAIRYLSDIKENPDMTPDAIARADEKLKATVAAVTHTSEAALVARMAWWTVEYGLMGDMKSPLIYGAGLLSSVGESQHCLSPDVKKIPLTADCVRTSYDITEPQPQLFVARDMDHLVEVLEDLEKTLAYMVGGVEALRRALKAETVTTVVTDTGVAASGRLSAFETDDDGGVGFVKFAGPVQLSRHDHEISGHGTSRHREGFSSPLGRWQGADRTPGSLRDGDLERLGIRKGAKAEIRFHSGFVVKGTVTGWHREEGNLALVTFRDCTVTKGTKTYFEPTWGEFDLLVGETVTSVHGGPADLARYGELEVGEATTTPGRSTPFTEDEKATHDVYRRLREIRGNAGQNAESQLASLALTIEQKHRQEWLAALEVVELVHQKLGRSPADFPWAGSLEALLRDRARTAEAPTAELITKGLALASTPD